MKPTMEEIVLEQENERLRQKIAKWKRELTGKRVNVVLNEMEREV